MSMTKKDMIAQKVLAAVNENEEFCKAFVSAEDASDLHKVLTANGFDFSVEDIEAMFADGLSEILKFKESGAADELDEGQLDGVAGGGAWGGTWRLAVSAAAGFGFGCLCGLCPAAAAATPYVVGGLTAWTTYGYMK